MVRLALALLALFAALLTPGAGGAGAQSLPSYSPEVVAALDLLDQSPATGELRGVLAGNRVQIQFVRMRPGVYARYSVARQVIEIDERWTDSDVIALAAVIAHEATHARDAVSGYLASGGASACIESEVRAFRTSAEFWIGQYGAAGKPDPTSDLEIQLNTVAARQVRNPDELESIVRQTYSEQCSP